MDVGAPNQQLINQQAPRTQPPAGSNGAPIFPPPMTTSTETTAKIPAASTPTTSPNLLDNSAPAASVVQQPSGTSPNPGGNAVARPIQPVETPAAPEVQEPTAPNAPTEPATPASDPPTGQGNVSAGGASRAPGSGTDRTLPVAGQNGGQSMMHAGQPICAGGFMNQVPFVDKKGGTKRPFEGDAAQASGGSYLDIGLWIPHLGEATF